ncbi:acyltransferase 3 [Pseudoxanthomonas suwonensis 11-1]|uniref:Acyltransferase 3 n=1 Tax=Pseudoxanthomonas suwonensis (strain 11-1) TaxID=743721 RepID=E6WXC7_PSEUU|nr:acyltransferase [Pseudoxanthomonas suwonensis]ADV28826.1 acyltransferase 3 [Pseudoxanthomonas suwonensis 11-1]
MSSPPPRTDIPSLTGLRGVAALMVVLYHANESFIRASGYASPHIFHGRLFVDLFYVLSGFVLCHVYVTDTRSISWRKFFAARVARVYPLHVLTALLGAAGLYALSKMSGQGLPPELTIGQAIRELTLTQAMPFIWKDLIWNSPSWSISVEFYTYVLIFPIIYIWLHRVRPSTSVLISGTLMAALIPFLFFADIHPARGAGAFLRASIGFLAGWSTWLVWKSPAKRLRPSTVLAVMVALFAGTQFYPTSLDDPWYVLPLMPVLVYGIAGMTSPLDRILSGRVLSYLGLVSYSVYLIHPLILKATQVVFSRMGLFQYGMGLFIAVSLALIIPCSYVSWRFFELPSRDWLKRRLD